MEYQHNYIDMITAGNSITFPEHGSLALDNYGAYPDVNELGHSLFDDAAPNFANLNASPSPASISGFRTDPLGDGLAHSPFQDPIHSEYSNVAVFDQSPVESFLGNAGIFRNPDGFTGSPLTALEGSVEIWPHLENTAASPLAGSFQHFGAYYNIDNVDGSPFPTSVDSFQHLGNVQGLGERPVAQNYVQSSYADYGLETSTWAGFNWQQGLPQTTLPIRLLDENFMAQDNRQSYSVATTVSQATASPPNQDYTDASESPTPSATSSASPQDLAGAEVSSEPAAAEESESPADINAPEPGGHKHLRNRLRRTLIESNAFARAHPIAPSPATSSANSPESEQADPAKARKVSKGRKREEKRRCEICSTELSGDHEYARHFKLVHEVQGWRWQVIDPSEKGLMPQFPVRFGISQCKNCQSNKLYGINYNAAAHIRRVHFKSTPSIKGGSKGGSSGGAWPEIRYLEYYHMKLVHVQVLDTPKTPGKTAKEGVDYIRSGREQATIYREASGKRHSSVPANESSHAEGQASYCHAFMMNNPGIGPSPSGDEHGHARATSCTAEHGRTWPGRHTVHPHSNGLHLSKTPPGSHEPL